jgi:ribosomal-protein-alanine N-acetyltransferase
MANIRLETERLILREYRWTDLEDHHRLIADPEIMYYIQDVFSRSIEESEENLRNAMADIENPDRTKVYLVIQTKEGSYVGGIGYTVSEINPAGKRVEIGYFTDPAFWGSGYATEALGALVRFAFCQDGVYRIDGTCIRENTRSRRVMEKCGMEFEGERRNFEWHHEKLKGRCFFGLLKEEWEGRQNGCEAGDLPAEERQEI